MTKTPTYKMSKKQAIAFIWRHTGGGRPKNKALLMGIDLATLRAEAKQIKIAVTGGTDK